MASDFYDLRPEQVPNAVTQSFPNVHFLAKSSTVERRPVFGLFGARVFAARLAGCT
jgi:hypothetical protein